MPSPELRAALAGVRGLLLDFDGVLAIAGQPIPGAPQAIRELERRRFPYRIVTNASMLSRASLARRAAAIGAPIPPQRFHSALTAAAVDAARRYPGQPLFVLATPDALTELDGLDVIDPATADDPATRVAAVIIGDDPDSATWENLNRAFRLVRRGAELVGMHRNRWWWTAAGETLDSGAFVTGLAFAAEVRPRIAGKPSPAFFRAVAAEVAAEAAERDGSARPPRADLAMVGDDLRADILAAKRVGLRGILVLTGKHGPADVERLAGLRRGGGRPDAVAPSLAEVVAALD